MSTEDTPEQPPLPAPDAGPTIEVTAARKSYRRKYRKIMVNFERKTRDGNALFKDEQRILDISQRLAEQTESQLLQLLVDLNSCPQVPKRLRYELRPKYLAKEEVLGKEQAYTQDTGHLALRKARYQLQTGETTTAEYHDLKDRLAENSDFAPAKSYAALTQSISGLPAQRNENVDALGSESTGFLTVKQEEQYLQSLDTYLNGDAVNPRSHAANSLGARNPEKTAERERETQLRNPVSVYNWLRKNKPSVFLQDNEASTDKPARPAGSRSSKRNVGRDSIVKQEEDLYDEDGIAVDMGTSKGKRKRDDDGGYRPKGGNSRPLKRKKEDTSTGRRSKKSSIDVR